MLILTKQNTITEQAIIWKVEDQKDIRPGLLSVDILAMPMLQEEVEIFQYICAFCKSYCNPCMDYIVTVRPRRSHDKLSLQRSQQ